MSKPTCITLCLLFAFPSFGQLFDDFSDGDLTMDPAWSGDLMHFTTTEDNWLQLDAAEGGRAFIYTPTSFADSVKWTIDLRMDFAPSASNTLRLYLMLDTSDVAIANGYYIEIGQNGSPDPICFHRLENGTPLLLACSQLGFHEEILAEVTITLRQNIAWHISATTTSTEIVELATLDDQSTVVDHGYFAIECNYTSTRSQSFYFDNLHIDEFFPDTIKPRLISVTPLNAQLIHLAFDEPVQADETSEAKCNNIPATIRHDPRWPSEVILELGDTLAHGAHNNIFVAHIRDTSSNVMEPIDTSFAYRPISKPTQADIIITEILYDESPAIGLPAAEYVEIYNRTSKTFSMDSIMLRVNSATENALEGILLPYSYAVIGNDSSFDVQLTSMPALSNSGACLTLLDNHGEVIHSVCYSPKWHTPGRDESGRSLELIDIAAPCSYFGLWTSSIAVTGGTPGLPNSVGAVSSDSRDTFGIKHYYCDDNLIELRLNRTLATNQSIHIEAIPGLQIFDLAIHDNVITLHTEEMTPGSVFSLSLDTVTDCAGLPYGPISIHIQVPDHNTGDIVVNEVMFDPLEDGAGYIEFLNYSHSSFSLTELILEIPDRSKTLGIPARITLPAGHVIAISRYPTQVRRMHGNVDPWNIIEVDHPTLDRDAGQIALFRRDGISLDSCAYDEAMHHPYISHTRGVALERIRPDLPGTRANSWHSASASAGWGTPGEANSQSMAVQSANERHEIFNRLFSPNNDGNSDFAAIMFGPEASDMVLNATIFDLYGQVVAALAQAMLLGSEETLFWDGRGADGNTLPAGIYLLVLELTDRKGFTESYKETLVLAERE